MCFELANEARKLLSFCGDSKAASVSGGTEGEGEKNDTFPRTWRSVSQGEMGRESPLKTFIFESRTTEMSVLKTQPCLQSSSVTLH